jgi:hypothetical protein
VIDLIWLYVGSLTLSAHNFWRDEMLKLEQEMFGENASSLGIVTRRRAFYPWLGKITGFSSTESLAYLLPLAFMAIWVYLLVK